MSDLPPLPEPRLGRYRHYKGGEYEVVGVARHSESLEPMVVYRPLHGRSGLWVRPYAMFFEEVRIEGQTAAAVRPRALTLALRFSRCACPITACRRGASALGPVDGPLPRA